jgi:hypothetical protein
MAQSPFSGGVSGIGPLSLPLRLFASIPAVGWTILPQTVGADVRDLATGHSHRFSTRGDDYSARSHDRVVFGRGKHAC